MMPKTAEELYDVLAMLRVHINERPEGVATERALYEELCNLYDDVPHVDWNTPGATGGLRKLSEYIVSLIPEAPSVQTGIPVVVTCACGGVDDATCKCKSYEGRPRDAVFEKIERIANSDVLEEANKRVRGSGFQGKGADLRVEVDVTAQADPRGLVERLKGVPLSYPGAEDGGLKYDYGKPRIGLVDEALILGAAEVLTYGAIKYDAENWRKGIEYQRIYDSLLRHLMAWHKGEVNDAESGLPHLGHAACCLMFLMGFEADRERYVKFDDRWEGTQRAMKPRGWGEDNEPRATVGERGAGDSGVERVIPSGAVGLQETDRSVPEGTRLPLES